jgi:hypothetical protein
MSRVTWDGPHHSGANTTSPIAAYVLGFIERDEYLRQLADSRRDETDDHSEYDDDLEVQRRQGA